MMRFELDHPTLRLGLVRAEGVSCGPSSPALLALLEQAEQAVRADATHFPEAARAALRDVLRKGGYKPTGRGKPASEFLLAAAQGQGLPRINNLVDINNLVSLASAHPISILDLERSGEELSVRFGRPGESYAFNAAGHVMDIAGLPVICRADEPIANAVKDSMLAKVHAQTSRVLALVYGSRALPQAQLVAACEHLATLLREHAGARDVNVALLPA